VTAVEVVDDRVKGDWYPYNYMEKVDGEGYWRDKPLPECFRVEREVCRASSNTLKQLNKGEWLKQL